MRVTSIDISVKKNYLNIHLYSFSFELAVSSIEKKELIFAA